MKMDLPTLETRLENWARAQWSSGGGGSSIASAEGMYRGGGWREIRAAPPQPDQRDAALVNEAWKRLMPLDKDVLKMWYVWKAPSSMICRRLRIKQGQGNGHHWELALSHAQRAIFAMLGDYSALAKPIRGSYNLEEMTETVD